MAEKKPLFSRIDRTTNPFELKLQPIPNADHTHQDQFVGGQVLFQLAATWQRYRQQ